MLQRQQMELGFDAARAFRPAAHRERRLSRARWWFEQMHRVVDRACGWQSAPPARPEQAYLYKNSTNT